MDKTIEIELNKAWQLRVNFEVESALRALDGVKVSLDLPVGEVGFAEVQDALRGERIQLKAEVFFLSASLDRVCGKDEAASKLLSHVDQCLRAISFPSFFRWSYELGSSAYRAGNFNLALEQFLRSAALAPSVLKKVWALGNAVLSLENLGLRYTETLLELHVRLKSLPPSQDTHRVKVQLHALRMREAFRGGSIFEAIALASTTPRHADMAEQCDYYRLWIEALPFHKSYRCDFSADLAAISQKANAIPFRAYRVRTLQGHLHPEDMLVKKSSEWVDRLYLWVWRSARRSRWFPSRRIVEVLKHLDPGEVGTELTHEDAQLLRNSLLWLGLWDRQLERNLKSWVGALEDLASEPYPLFQMEALLVKYLIAVRDAQSIIAEDFRLALEQHPLWKSKDLHFSLFSKKPGKVPAQCKDLLERVRGLSRTKPENKSCLCIDFESYTI